MASKALSLRDPDGRFLAAQKSALAASKAALGDSALDGLKRKKSGKKRRRSKRGMHDSLSFSSLKDSLSDGLADFGQNVANNAGSVLNPIGARDIGIALAGALFYLVVPPAMNVITRRNFDHNGAGGVLMGLGLATGVGLVMGNVPFIAGAMSAAGAQAAYAYLDKQVVEKFTGVRFARLDPKADATMADGIYDDQPYPKRMMIDGQEAYLYSHDDMMRELEKGKTIRMMHENGESVNHLADSVEPPLLADGTGQFWLADGVGGYVKTDESGDPIPTGQGNFFYRAPDGTMKIVDMEMNEVVEKPAMHTQQYAQSTENQYAPTMRDAGGRTTTGRGAGRYANSRAGSR